jgi:hypothetical protein
MDTFSIIVLSGIAFTLLVLLGVGALSRVRTRDITDKEEYRRLDGQGRMVERVALEPAERRDQTDTDSRAGTR